MYVIEVPLYLLMGVTLKFKLRLFTISVCDALSSASLVSSSCSFTIGFSRLILTTNLNINASICQHSFLLR